MNAPRPDPATQAQIDAARPDASTWLAANAGSGKTRVLTDRVARLLLEEVNPQNILCLTYTKAAASEMQNRLFRRLGEWAMLPDDALRAALAKLGYTGSVPPEKLSQARKLFASAIETPGGLKIQTIHAFCSSILRRFPLEAGISPRFEEMDDRTSAQLRQDVIEAMAEGPRRPLIEAVARHIGSDDTLDKLAQEICGQAQGFADTLTLGNILEAFSLPSDFREDNLPGIALDGSEAVLVQSVIAAAASTSKTYSDFATDLAAAISLPRPEALEKLYGLCLYQSDHKDKLYRRFDSKSRNFPQSNHGKAVEAFATIASELHALMDRVHDAKMAELTLASARRTHALHQFASAFLTRYEAQKMARGWLDFDDLITRARALLNDPAVAAWVLYRLDGGIDHILVDEAQDTSPAQWNVIERLAQEFTSGEGARAGNRRTIFVVGDKKQSIYSFQGADPREFDRMRAEFAERLEKTPTPLGNHVLHYSFRSSRAVLELVDKTFEGHEAAGFDAGEGHLAFFDSLPGRVDLWPVVAKSDDPEKREWHDPVDMVGPDAPASILARQIAAEIRRLIQAGETIPDRRADGTLFRRALGAGDFLILVQRRNALFEAIIRECKAAGLPIAGADRLRLGAELAVRDIAALLRFLATPEDDLSLATALRSPLFGWSEQQLYSLAQPRKGYLWEALRKEAAAHPETIAMLDDLRRQTDYLRPYDLIERILLRHDGRRKLLSRLGREAEDGVDALLTQALAYERLSVPSLTGFLVWLETDDVEIKRQMESAGDQIRVMTVHGAKGLEAPVVILPDTAKRVVQVKDQLLQGEALFWKPPADEVPPLLDGLIEVRKQREREERERLLYVAMTRAEKWLVVCAAGETGGPGESWYGEIEAAMAAQGAAATVFEFGEGLRLEAGDWAGLETNIRKTPEAAKASLPPWAGTSAPIPAPRPKPVTPSGLPGAKALPGEAGLDEEAAKRRGRQIHRLLEFLPLHDEAEYEATAARLLSTGPDAAEGAELALLLDEARRVLSKPALAPLFSGEALAEVPVTANLPELGGRRMHGIVDRLIIGEGEILAVDFKTNAVVPDTAEDCPDALLRQMGAYASALRQIFPGKVVSVALLWTRNATLMHLPHDLVMHSLQTTQMLDAPPPET